jgi:pyrimidine operon attenuation protein / uracil phosphoribosyltransferase
LAQRLAQIITRIEKVDVPVGTLDVTQFRDDLPATAAKSSVQKVELEIPITGKTVILVDDVLYTGRTARAAMDALFRHGRPIRVQLCIFVDRGHRELPIESTFVGRKVQTTSQEFIKVQLGEVDQTDKVLLVEKPA